MQRVRKGRERAREGLAVRGGKRGRRKEGPEWVDEREEGNDAGGERRGRGGGAAVRDERLWLTLCRGRNERRGSRVLKHASAYTRTRTGRLW